MRLRSNAPLTSGSLNHRTEIATYADGRTVGYDPRTGTGTGFDVAGIAVTVNDVIAYDRIGSLTWDSDTWREWTYMQVGLTVSDDELPSLGLPPGLPPGMPAPLPGKVGALTGGQRPLRSAALRTGGAVVLAVAFAAAFVFGTFVTSPPRSSGAKTTDTVTAVSSDAARANAIVQRDSASAVPAYVIVAAGVQPKLGLVGDVVVSPPDAEATTARRKTICTEIARREGFVVVRLFRTADAYVAMRDATFRAENPGAIRHGFLGILMKDGTYRTAEELNWNIAIPAQ